jgi:hypothetical protein
VKLHTGADTMFLDNWLRGFEPESLHGLVFSAGGGADIVFARLVAEKMIEAGASKVDVAQARNRYSFSPEVVERYGLVPLGKTGKNQVMKFSDVVANHHPDGLRGKGMAMAAAVEWGHGERLVFAAKEGSSGPEVLAERSWKLTEPYDFAIAIDGGGDILTGGKQEFDRVVLDAFKANWNPVKPLGLLVVGLGADMGSSEGSFSTSSPLDGWQLSGESVIGPDASDRLVHLLGMVNRLHPDPLNWGIQDDYWSYGLHVPQIVSLAAQSALPTSMLGPPYVLVPRPSKQKSDTEINDVTKQPWPVFNIELLRTARWYQPV